MTLEIAESVLEEPETILKFKYEDEIEKDLIMALLVLGDVLEITMGRFAQ
jgi:hypothetical protein